MGLNETPYLTGRVLLAMPSLTDPRFHRAVIYICSHDAGGAMGLVINHPLPGLGFTDLIGQLNIDPAAKENLSRIDLPVLSGGPVESARGFLLHSSDFRQSDTVVVDEAFGVTGTIDALKAVAAGKGPKDMLFMLGYAGWSAGQLDREMQENAWLVVPADPALIFHTGAAEKWDMAIGRLGVDPAMLSSVAGRA